MNKLLNFINVYKKYWKLIKQHQELQDKFIAELKRSSKRIGETNYYIRQVLFAVELLHRIKKYNPAVFSECIYNDETSRLGETYEPKEDDDAKNTENKA